ncbi:NAD(P)-dependent oxidoreductase [Phytoactinopolyspora alkaliphila]|uniref:NAD(P)-dependent oxidoreductase n=1 Tax=Phytoactinopolyspora alkaliphila TaxID=1783498 RepID=A0A6N9YSF2_9ACTN|nr:NAD(P)-dependent oxidoreductase [Phytoactinopolyspora alkaliphila]
MKILVIGAAGRVGAMIVGELGKRHSVRGADLHEGQLIPGAAESVAVNVTDISSLHRAAKDQDALVYVAMGRQDGWGSTGGWAESHFDVNVKGLYLSIQAAVAAGAHRVVYASSLSIFHSYLDHGHELDERAPDATDAYGLTKRLGEQVCEAAVREHGIDVVSLRLCGPLPDEEYAAYDGPMPEIRTAGSDVASAFVAALERPVRGFEALVVCGDREQRYVSWDRTLDVLGWEPRADRTQEVGSG